MVTQIQKSLLKLKDCQVTNIIDNNTYPESGSASIVITFSDGTKLRADYWRIIRNQKAFISSFDHQQKYGLPAPINAKEEIIKELQGKYVLKAQLDTVTGDILFDFNENRTLQIFNFTGYEIWEINFPDGTGEYSNYAK